MTQPSSPALRSFTLIWWDFEQQKAQNITLPFPNSKAAWDFMMNIPGLDTRKKCGAFPKR